MSVNGQVKVKVEDAPFYVFQHAKLAIRIDYFAH